MELELFHNHFNDLIIKVQTLEEECDALQANLEAAGDGSFGTRACAEAPKNTHKPKLLFSSISGD